MTISSRVAATASRSLLLFASPVLRPDHRGARRQDAIPSSADRQEGRKSRTAAESLECSKEADAKGLHGKERKKFRSDCKKAAMDKKTITSSMIHPPSREGGYRLPPSAQSRRAARAADDTVRIAAISPRICPRHADLP